MGKASSAKKVARAARAGGKAKGQRRHLGFPIGMAVLVLAGVGLVAVARDSNSSGSGSPKLGEHWHAAYGVYICDRWVQNFSDKGADKVGIHTHDDGLIHIHPFVSGAAGDNATLGKFFDQVGVKVTDSSITLPPGTPFKSRKYLEGETTCGGKDARVVLARWDNALDTDGEPKVLTSGISGHQFENDLAAYTLAFVPKGKKIPPPPSAPTILQGASADGGAGLPPTGIPAQNDLPGGGSTPTEGPAGTGSVPAEIPGGTGAPGPTGSPPSTGAPPSSEGAEGGAGSG